MKRHLLLAALVVLAVLAACDSEPVGVADVGDNPVLPSGPLHDFTSPPYWYTIFTSQTPASTLDATPGWEVGTRFYTSVEGCVIGFRFYRASGETGSNQVKLWTNSGTLLRSRTVASSGTGWKELYLYHPLADHRVCIAANTYYRVSVNTNTAQVKTFGAFDNGPITNGPLTATQGYYGQPTGSMPGTVSNSNFFVDVIFQEGPLQ